MHKISTGSDDLNILLNGGYEEGVISTIYGPAGSGKTGLCILAAITMVRAGKRVIYIDTENSFSLERFKQICDAADCDYTTILNSMIFLTPSNFEEQKKTFEQLSTMITESVGMIIVDSIAMLYRLEIGKNGDVYDTNRDLGRQIATLSQIARKNLVPILLTNQVYADFEHKERVNLVGGDLLKYGSKCLLELQKLHSANRRAIVRKHRSIPDNKELVFKIVDAGIEAVENKPLASEKMELF